MLLLCYSASTQHLHKNGGATHDVIVLHLFWRSHKKRRSSDTLFSLYSRKTWTRNWVKDTTRRADAAVAAWFVCIFVAFVDIKRTCDVLSAWTKVVLVPPASTFSHSLIPDILNTHTLLNTNENNHQKLTMIIVDVITAVHLERQRTVRTSPSLDADAFVLAILQRTLAMTRTAVLAASYRQTGFSCEIMDITIHDMCIYMSWCTKQFNSKRAVASNANLRNCTRAVSLQHHISSIIYLYGRIQGKNINSFLCSM